MCSEHDSLHAHGTPRTEQDAGIDESGVLTIQRLLCLFVMVVDDPRCWARTLLSLSSGSVLVGAPSTGAAFHCYLMDALSPPDDG
jgi:hypothetical protein